MKIIIVDGKAVCVQTLNLRKQQYDIETLIANVDDLNI